MKFASRTCVGALVLFSAIAARTVAAGSPQIIQHNTWTLGAPVPNPVNFPSAGVLNGKIYLIGGVLSDYSTIVADTQIYDLVANTWSAGVPLPIPTAAGGVAVFNGVLYYIGGNVPPTYAVTMTNAVWAFSFKTGKWSPKAPMPTARDGLSAVVVNNKIYAVGGWDGSQTLATVESYNPVTNSWQEEAPMQLAKASFAIGLFKTPLATTIVAAGGVSSGVGGSTSDNEGYNVVVNTWNSLTADPTVRGATCAGTIGSKLYVAGGINGGPAYDLTESYSLSKNAWTILAHMPYPVNWVSASPVVYKGKLYCIGGANGFNGSVVNYVQIYQP